MNNKENCIKRDYLYFKCYNGNTSIFFPFFINLFSSIKTSIPLYQEIFSIFFVCFICFFIKNIKLNILNIKKYRNKFKNQN